MTLRTYGYNVKGSFNKWIKAHVATIQSEINAALGTAYSIVYYPQKNPETFPAVRSWFYLSDEPIDKRHRLADTVQLDIFVKSANPSTPDDRLMTLIRDNLKDKMGIQTKRGAFHGFFDVKDYAANPTTPNTLNKCRIESLSGWMDRPSDDPDIAHLSADFKLFHL